MNRVLEDIECIPGVSGACFYSTQKGIISQKISHDKVKENIGSVAKIIAKMYAGGVESYGDVEKISLKFNEINIITTTITDRVFIIIFHKEEINKHLLEMTISESVKTLKSHIANHEKSKKSIPSSHEEPTTKIEKINSAIEVAIKAEPVTQALCVMEKMLNKIMGPISSIVFNDSLQTWLKNSRDQNNFSIDMLAGLLFEEINDPEKIDAYKTMIDPHLKPVREQYHGNSA